MEPYSETQERRPQARAFARPIERGLRVIVATALAVGFSMSAGKAAGFALRPYKDDLFGYGRILESRDNGAFLKVDYDEMRDINGRDQIRERRAKRAYVSLGVKAQTALTTIAAGAQTIEVAETGAIAGARFAVIFIHGRGGDRRLGTNDWTFGGNFNRIKNLAVLNGGVYLAPTVASFDAAGAASVGALIEHVANAAPGVRIVLACGSMGSFICWQLAEDKATVASLAGMMILGGVSNTDYVKTPAFKAALPLFFAQGSRDSVYSWEDQLREFERIRSLKRGYPTRFVLFETGSHGTPIRMTDWRDALNWIFAAR